MTKGVAEMSIKVELGNKIRKLREEQGLSRGDLCEGEEGLTVRQLARIEAGESLPTLPKLEFIAERLSVSVSLLADKKYVELPKRYLQLKHRLYKAYTYNEEERITRKEQYFTEIYEEYYDKLPEEEQLSIDVQQATMDVHLARNADFGEEILSDYFSQVLVKKEYSINNLLIIDLYFHCIYYENYDEKLFILLFKKVMKKIDSSVDIELFLINKILITAINVLVEYDNYDKLLDAVRISNLIMKINQDFQKKPIIDMVEGKYYLFSEKNLVEAKKKYKVGAQLAELHGSPLLSKKIMKEWEMDLAIFEQQFLK